MPHNGRRPKPGLPGSPPDVETMNFGVSKDIIEDIRNRCDIVELIGTFVQLKRSGANTYKGLCPFHQEKTPSFHVDASRQTYHCFGCGKGGDVFRFYMDRENVGFNDALHMLASRVGVVIPESSFSGTPEEGRQRAGERERLYRINAEFCDFFRRALVSNPDSPPSLYLKKRGIPSEIAERFKIGACPDEWTACLAYGRSLGFTDAELVAAGIVRRKEETGRCFDHFKGRLTFAIENEQGRVVGFSARSLEPKPLAGGKYINTPETPVFKKGNLLYALPLARRMMTERNLAILCEGQLDTIAFHRAGFECAVAPQGTGFTEGQARILRRYTNRVFLAFDADAAGQKAILRAVEILLPLSFDIRAIRIPGGKDPDELYANGGAEALAQAVDAAVPWLSILCGSLPERHDMTTPAGRGQAAEEVAGYLCSIKNQVELELYVREAAAALQVSEEAIYAELRQVNRARRRDEEFRVRREAESPGARKNVQTPPAHAPAILTLLELAVNSENAARRLSELLMPDELPADDLAAQAVNLAINAALNGEFDQVAGEISSLLVKTPDPAVSRLLVETHVCRDPEKAIQDSIAELRRQRLRKQRQELTARLRVTTDAMEKIKILSELQNLK